MSSTPAKPPPKRQPKTKKAAAAEPKAEPVYIDAQKALLAQREAARQEILRQREEAKRRNAQPLPTAGGATTICEDRSRWLTGGRGGQRASAPLVETRVFCVAEARRFGEEKLVQVRRACQGDVFFQGHERGQWPESSPFA